jgi:hypothetical protein
MAKCRTPAERLWYARQSAEQGWSQKPIGVAEWETRIVKSLPKGLKGSLPSVEEIERELRDAE